jgi:PhnB protein
MITMNPYLNFEGNTEEAFNFYRSVFGGEFFRIQRFKETPEAGRVPKEEQEKLMHVSLPIGKGNMLMATDALASMGQKMVAGNNFSLSLNVDSEAEADALFAKLAAGGKAEMPLKKEFWGAYFGMLTDKFGIRWMVSHDPGQK